MKKYIAVLEIEDDEEIIDARVTYFYSNNGMSFKATEKMELKEKSEDEKNKTYEDGLKEAWELARDIIALPNSENKSLIGVRYNAFGNDALYDIIRNYSASEVIEKIKEYEEFKVGDEVVDKNEWGIRGVVTETSERCISIVENDGSVSRWKKDEFNKTGRHYPQIEEMLKQMKENE